MSNAADKSTATQTVRSGGFLWLNLIAMSVVNCNRAEVVECYCPKPCWSGVGRRYLLMVGKICFHDFRGWAEKRDDRYGTPWDVSLPSLGIGVINETYI